MTILITNDDGIYAPGLAALRAALAPLGEVLAIAPEGPRSACGHAITLHKPLRLTPVELADSSQAFAANGTPADCIALGLSEHLGPRPALVVSGINLGPNLGVDMLYSGTVAAAMEGAICGLPSFAISITSHHASHLPPAARFAHHLAQAILQHGLPPATFLNVNVPASDVKGIAFTRQGRASYHSRIERRTDPRGAWYYWLTGERVERPTTTDTDAEAIANDLISITPLRLDLTDEHLLSHLPSWNLHWPPP